MENRRALIQLEKGENLKAMVTRDLDTSRKESLIGRATDVAIEPQMLGKRW